MLSMLQSDFVGWVVRLSRICRIVPLGLCLLGPISGKAQSFDHYGWEFELPFGNGHAAAGDDGSVFIAGEADGFWFRGVYYPSTSERDVILIKILPSGGLGRIGRQCVKPHRAAAKYHLRFFNVSTGF